MSLKDRAHKDLARVFMRTGHFAGEHRWNGMAVTCIVDEELAYKRRRDNVVDVAWDANSHMLTVEIAASALSRAPKADETVLFDKTQYKIEHVQEDEGLYIIDLRAYEPRTVGY